MRHNLEEKPFQIKLANSKHGEFDSAFELFQFAIGNSKFIRNDCLNYDQMKNRSLSDWFDEHLPTLKKSKFRVS